ncbi:MAG: hypothetical protein AAF591_22745 [Verrucomicrobiota bacterium]
MNTLDWAENGRLITGSHAPILFAHVWNPDTGERLAVRRGKTLFVATSNESRYVVTKTWNTRGVQVWDLETLQTIHEFSDYPNGFHAAAFSPDDRMLVAAVGPNYELIAWETSNWRKTGEFIGHNWLATDLSFTPDGKRLASAGPDNQCLVWDVATQQQVARFERVTTAFSPDGSTLAVGGSPVFNLSTSSGKGSSVRFYHAPTPKEVEEQRARRARESSVTGDPRQHEVYPTNTGAIKEWLVLAPVPWAPTKDYAYVKELIPGEGRLKPRANETVSIGGTDLAWQPVTLKDDHRLTYDDLSANLYQSRIGIYAVSYLESETDLDGLSMWAEINDHARIFLNGEVVTDHDMWTRSEEIRVEGVALKAGKNTIVFKLINLSGSWSLSLRFTDADGAPIPGLRATLYPGE